jgi:hypothetical protein
MRLFFFDFFAKNQKKQTHLSPEGLFEPLFLTGFNYVQLVTQSEIQIFFTNSLKQPKYKKQRQIWL